MNENERIVHMMSGNDGCKKDKRNNFVSFLIARILKEVCNG